MPTITSSTVAAWIAPFDGLDTLNGGAGNDTYSLTGEDVVVIDASGIDTCTSTDFSHTGRLCDQSRT